MRSERLMLLGVWAKLINNALDGPAFSLREQSVHKDPGASTAGSYEYERDNLSSAFLRH